MTSRSLIGTGLDQIPVNAMLGGLAYQSPENATIKNLDLRNIAEINAETADAAVDVFVYDTSKDSDGGAWRQRTKHTSWYNEPLNTPTRGSRKEFPAVAVIVITNNDAGLTIYDGDDPDLPMWMVFNESAGQSIWTGTNRSSVTALNGIIVVGQLSTIPLPIIGFVADEMYNRRTDTTKYNVSNIANRHVFSPSLTGYFDQGLNSTAVNDVAMTVLPRAPIDPDTGLQVPTIAVGTNSGVSVIKNDGSVVDITATSYDYTSSISFTEDNKLIFSWDSNTRARFIHVYDIPSSDVSHGGVGYQYGAGKRFYTNYDPVSKDLQIWNNTSLSWETKEVLSTAIGHSEGLTLLDENPTSPANGMVAYATTSYNTGWMHGDIKGAFLSDTDSTNIANHSSGNLINYNGNNAGDFNSADDLNAWTGSGLSHDAANNRLVNDKSVASNFSVDNILTIGKRYELSWDVASQSPSYGKLMLNSTTAGSGSAISLETGSGSGSYEFTAADTDLDFYLFNGGSNHVANINSITIVPVVDDRSVNNNGLQVFGTITKQPVATGAELVGYRPPSGTVGNNYLSKSLTSSDFDLTSDWSITFWAKKNEQTADNYSGFEIAEDDLTGNNAYAQIPFSIYIDTSGNTGWRGANVTGYQYNTLFDTQDVWKCVTTVSKSGNLYIYVNGEYVTSTPATFANPSSPYSLGIFRFTYSTTRHDGRRHIDYALFRMSNSAPSPEQIKKIYEDERVLFQENAACTLYGSSDAVTALAYDDSTSLLHVGTSSGRSDFTGLKRINHDTSAVSTAISAKDGLIAQQ